MLKNIQKWDKKTGKLLYPVDQSALITFIKRLDKKKIKNCHFYYLKANLLSNGIGYIQNYPEAYRLYLIAASMGHEEASEEIYKVQEYYEGLYANRISKEEIKEARCLAEKGPYPSWMQKQLCKW